MPARDECHQDMSHPDLIPPYKLFGRPVSRERYKREVGNMDAFELDIRRRRHEKKKEDKMTVIGGPGSRPQPDPIDLSVLKETNPKDAVGIKKAPVSTVSGAVVAEMGLAMLEGARKYGRHNYRVSGVRASVYRDAAWRHLNKWWEGEDIDPDSGLNHITKALACLSVLRDAMIFDNWVDDRPPALPDSRIFWKRLDELAASIIKRYPDGKVPFNQVKPNNTEA